MDRLVKISGDKLNSTDGMITAVIQDDLTQKVLMAGWVNKKEIEEDEAGNIAVYCSSANKLLSHAGNSEVYLKLAALMTDQGKNYLLIKIHSDGTIFQEGTKTDFGEENKDDDVRFLGYLQDFIDQRKREMPEKSYTTSLFEKGTRKIAQKVGEEAVETIIGAMANDDENFLYESGDLIYHLIVLLSHKGYGIRDIAAELKKRHS